MATTKKYVSLDKLGLYDEKIKALIDSKDAAALKSAKDYADGLATNYDAAGAAGTAESNAKSYTDEQIAAVNTTVSGVKTTAEKGVADAATAQAAAEAAQADVDSLETYVGTIPEGATATNVVAYVQEKTSGIATSENLQELTTRVTAAEGEIDALQADHLVTADKTELEGKIETAQAAADSAKTHSEGVAADLATEVTNRTNADSALDKRIQTLEGQITGLSGAMHFVGVKESVPADVSGYAAGDVITVGDKEYVFNGTSFVEFGDVSAEGERIGALETKMTTAEGNITQAQADIDAVEAAILLKADQTALDNEVTARTNADTTLSNRIKTLEDAVGSSGSVATDIATAKQEAIDAAAADATTKDEALETKITAAYKAYADAEDEKIESRVATLETASSTHALASDLTALAGRVTTAEGEIDTLQEEMDAVEAKAAANETAIGALQTAVAGKVAQSDFDTLSAKVTANETAIASFVEVSEEEVLALFQQ